MGKEYNRYNLVAGFKNFLTAENVSSSTAKNYLSDIRHFFGWLQINLSSVIASGDLRSEAISVDIVSEYKHYLISNNLPLKTVNRRLSTLRKFFSFCISQGWMKENPAKAVQNHKVDNRTTNNVIQGTGTTLESVGASSSLTDRVTDITKFKKYLEKVGFKKDQIKQTITDVNEFLTVTHSL